MISVVTGGSGFVGSHLVDRLLAEGHIVRVIATGKSGNILKNLNHTRGNPNLEIYIADIRNREEITLIFKGADYVFHIAALADIVPSIQNPEPYFSLNVMGTYNILDCVKNSKTLKKFLYAASMSCYGIPDFCPTPETAEIRPKYPYALTKVLGEETVLHWGSVYKIPVISLRLANVYGPRMRVSSNYGAAFSIFLAQKLAGKPFTVVGSGEQTRDFTFVTDVADAFYTAAISNINQEIFNVGSGGTYSVNRLCELLGGDIIHIPDRPGEPRCIFADTRKIEHILGWHAKISFEEGVKKVLDNIDYWRDAPLWTPENINKATEGWFKYLGNSKNTK